MTFLKWIAIGVMPFVMIVLGVLAYLTVTKPPLPAPQKAQTKQISRKLILKAIKKGQLFLCPCHTGITSGNRQPAIRTESL